MNKPKVIALVIVAFYSLLPSCSMTSQERAKADKYREERSFQDGVAYHQFMLPYLPNWGQVSPQFSCRKEVSIQYINFSKMSKNFNLNYEELVQFQTELNGQINKSKFPGKSIDKVPSTSFSNFFLNSLNQIRARIFPLRLFSQTKNNHFSFIVYEDFQKRPHEFLRFLKDNKRNPEITNPVFISVCLTRESLRKKLNDLGIETADLLLISSESLSVYVDENNLGINLHLDLDKIFMDKGKKREVVVYYRHKNRSTNLFRGRNLIEWVKI